MKISIIGSGGHCNIIISLIEEVYGINSIDNIYDEDINKINTYLYNIKIKNFNEIKNNENMIIAIGNNNIRKNINNKLKHKNIKWKTLIHPFTYINKTSIIEEGSIICAGVIIQPNVKIGKHSIINTNSSIDHDCILEDYTHIAPGSTLCGNIFINEGTFIGAKTVIKEKILINGKWNIIGCGSVVIKNIDKNKSIYYGHPAKYIK